MTNILVTSAGAGPSVSVIKALMAQAEVPVTVIASDMDKTAAGLYLADDLIISPSADNEPEFLEFFESACKTLKIDFIMCPFDIDNMIFSKFKDRIFNNTGAVVLCNNFESTMRCSDKIQSIRHCKKHGIQTPKTYTREMPPVFLNPLIIKPKVGFGGKRNEIISTLSEFKSASLHSDSFCQDFISGVEYTIDIISDMRGQPLAALPRERVSVKSGQTVKGRVNKDETLINYGLNLAKTFSLVGVSCAQCIKNKDGIFFIEMNPRYGTGVSLACGAGINMPLLHIKLALGKGLLARELNYDDGVFMSRYHEEVFTK